MGLFSKFKEGLSKTRQFVAQSFNRIAAGLGYFDEDMLDDLEMTLVQADCGIPCATAVLEQIRADIRRSGDNSSAAVLNSLRSKLLEILGEAVHYELQANTLNILLMVGVNGTGKTTSSGKLAYKFQQGGAKVMMAAADTFRAAAIEQLKVWGERAGVPVIANSIGSDPAAVVFDAVQAAKARKADLLIIDTAGRLHNKQNLMDELAKIRRIIDREAPEAKLDCLLTVDASTGQNALAQAKAFSEATKVDGLILSKLDGNAKGGVALAVAYEEHLPLYYAGLGEGIEDLQEFDEAYFVDSLLPESVG